MYTLKSGLSLSLLDERTPKDVLEELVECQNEYNRVAGVSSFVELFVKSKEIEDKYRAKRTEDRRLAKTQPAEGGGGDTGTGTSDGYEKAYREWFLPQFGERWKNSFEFFKQTKDTTR